MRGWVLVRWRARHGQTRHLARNEPHKTAKHLFLEPNRHLADINTAQNAINYIATEMPRAPETAAAAKAAGPARGDFGSAAYRQIRPQVRPLSRAGAESPWQGQPSSWQQQPERVKLKPCPHWSTLSLQSSVVSYLTSRPSSDPIKSAWQKVTQQWWNSGLTRVTGCISPYVIQEISAGDVQAAGERIEKVRELVMLDTRSEIEALADYCCWAAGCLKRPALMLCILLALHFIAWISC